MNLYIWLLIAFFLAPVIIAHTWTMRQDRKMRAVSAENEALRALAEKALAPIMFIVPTVQDADRMDLRIEQLRADVRVPSICYWAPTLPLDQIMGRRPSLVIVSDLSRFDRVRDRMILQEAIGYLQSNRGTKIVYI